MTPQGDRYSGRVLHHGTWGPRLPEYDGMVKHCWKPSDESVEKEEEKESAVADAVSSAPPAAAT